MNPSSICASEDEVTSWLSGPAKGKADEADLDEEDDEEDAETDLPPNPGLDLGEVDGRGAYPQPT